MRGIFVWMLATLAVGCGSAPDAGSGEELPPEEDTSPVDEDSGATPTDDTGAPSDDSGTTDTGSADTKTPPPDDMRPDLAFGGWNVYRYGPSASDPVVNICLNRTSAGASEDRGDHIDVKNLGKSSASGYEIAVGIVPASGGAATFGTPHLTADGAHAPGVVFQWKGPICVPIDTGKLTPGDYRIRLELDPGHVVDEADETNNISDASSTFKVVEKAAVPPWLVGTYSRYGKTASNVQYKSDNLSISFSADGSYTLSTYPGGSNGSGKFTITGTTVSFDTGPYAYKTFDLSKDVYDSCRSIRAFGSAIWRKDDIPSCPTLSKATLDECKYVGTYTKKDHSGYTGSTSSNSTDWTWTVVVDRDHFFTSDYTKFNFYCYGDSCKDLYDADQTSVGTWSVAGGAGGYSLTTLRSAPWVFKPSSKACPM